MTGDTMKYFDTGISDPLDPNGNTMMIQEYHIYPPVTWDRLLTRDETNFQFIKQYAARKK